MTKVPIAKSKNDISVYVDMDKANVPLHIKEQPDLMKYVKLAILEADLVNDKEVIERDFGQTIGTTSLVETRQSDEIVYAKRIQRETYMRFVKKREVVPTQKVTAILYRKDDGYDLWSAWIGPLVPTTPGTQTEMPTSIEFWSSHALTYDETVIQTDTVTTNCPW